MHDPNAWPKLTWKSNPDVDWLQQRIHEIAIRARKFESALEEAGVEEEIDLNSIEDGLTRWQGCTSNVFTYTGLGEGRKLQAEEASDVAAGLAQVYEEMRGLRRELLASLGGAAAQVLARETKIEIDEEMLRAPPVLSTAEGGEPFPRPEGEVNMLTGESAALFQLAPRHSAPVTAEEMRMRAAAEQKPLPDSGNLGALLAMLPSDWIATIFDSLQLPAEFDEELTMGSRSAARRGVIFEHLRREDFLVKLVASLDVEDRELLGELLAEGGAAPYQKITASWGFDGADGFYWRDRPPSGPLARLRRCGLAFVGTRDLKMYVKVPTDLAPLLQRALLAE